MVLAGGDARQPTVGLPIPIELHCKIFALLGFKDKINCQRVCKAWNQVLREPLSPIWGNVALSMARPELVPTVQASRDAFQRWSTVSRWIKQRAPGISVLRIGCSCCWLRGPSECKGDRGHLMALLACLKPLTVDIDLVFKCSRRERPPFTQGPSFGDISSRLIQITLHSIVLHEDLLAFGDCKRLACLAMSIMNSCKLTAEALEGLGSLPRLQHLEFIFNKPAQPDQLLTFLWAQG
ncbi:hypothetical protein WJX73_001228 [Symbiochloris irregularis]|uniref:F-box domain-containing protein n=1 Tax=Symbiochloris irregularis TaxID=706552 RepID=A0AAW1NWV2_9CHLO